jgi:hypothetical protein
MDDVVAHHEMELRTTVAYLLAKEDQKFAAKRKWSPPGAGLGRPADQGPPETRKTSQTKT